MEVNELFKCLDVREGFKCSKGSPPLSGCVVARSAFSLKSSSGILSRPHSDGDDGDDSVDIYETEQQLNSAWI